MWLVLQRVKPVQEPPQLAHPATQALYIKTLVLTTVLQGIITQEQPAVLVHPYARLVIHLPLIVYLVTLGILYHQALVFLSVRVDNTI